MKILKKIFIILICILLITLLFNSTVCNADSIYEKVKTMAKDTSQDTNSAVTSVKSVAGSIITVAKIICAGVAIIMITVIAMKYMLAAPSEKADIKKHAVVYVIGAVVMFAATGILQIIQNFATTALPE